MFCSELPPALSLDLGDILVMTPPYLYTMGRVYVEQK
jgi:hypothetical protein